MKTKAIILTTMFFMSCFTTWITAKDYRTEAVQDDLTEAEMYTQTNMWAYKGIVNAVNYSVEIKIPVNTKVKIINISDGKIWFKYVDEPKVAFEIVNVSKYTGLNIKELAKRYFGPKPVDISIFTEKEQEFIKNFEGFFEAGISKKAVLVGRGYPPGHRTASTELDTWVYWRNKWKNRGLNFKDGKTYSINGTPLE